MVINLDDRQKLIQRVVRVSSSEYTMNLASNVVYDSTGVNNQSDRTGSSGSTGQLTKKGVSVKHDSYARYLAKKKGRVVLKADNPTNERPAAKYGGKNYKFAIVSNCSCN